VTTVLYVSLIEVVSASSTSGAPEVCELYWLTDENGNFVHTVKAIAEQYGITSNELTKTVNSSCSAYTTDLGCPTCHRGFKIRSRSHFADLRRYPARTCADCEEAARLEAERQAAKVEAQRIEAIAELFTVEQGERVVVADLSLRQAMTLGALIRGIGGDHHGIVSPLSQRSERLAPSDDLSLRLVESIWSDGLIEIHPTTSVGAFGWEADAPKTVLLDCASFYIRGAGDLGSRLSDFTTQFDALVELKDWPESWAADLALFWKELAASEATANLVFYLRQHGLEFNPGEGTKSAIEQGLEWFNLGEMFNFIWRAAKDAAAYYSRERVPKPQAANSAVTRLRNSIERAYAEGWAVKPYRRDTRLGVSAISQLFFTRSLQLKDPLAFNPISEGRTPLKLRWDRMTSESFERLIFRLASEAEGYTEVNWLMKTNAPDHGRDIGAMRLRHDSLSGYTHERLIIQCKHWLSRSLADDDVAKEVVSVDHWDKPPVDVLAIATSGRFTANAVSWVERHNAKGVRPRVEMWNDAKLETLLSTKPHLILDFELR
jgi:hypothetical protein